MNGEKALELVRKSLDDEHSFGEGAGGSGHLASVGLGELEIVSLEETERHGEPCTEVVYTCGIDRQSEFGGQSFRYRKRVVFGASGEVVEKATLEEKVYDLMTGEEIDFFGFLGLAEE